MSRAVRATEGDGSGERVRLPQVRPLRQILPGHRNSGPSLEGSSAKLATYVIVDGEELPS
jgi:hypothetical protein